MSPHSGAADDRFCRTGAGPLSTEMVRCSPGDGARLSRRAPFRVRFGYRPSAAMIVCAAFNRSLACEAVSCLPVCAWT